MIKNVQIWMIFLKFKLNPKNINNKEIFLVKTNEYWFRVLVENSV